MAEIIKNNSVKEEQASSMSGADNQNNEEEIIRTHTEITSYSNPRKGMKALLFWLSLTCVATGYIGSGLDEIWVVYFFIIQVIPGFVLFFASLRDRKTRNMLIYTAVIALLSVGILALWLMFPECFKITSGRFFSIPLYSFIVGSGAGLIIYGITGERNSKRLCTVEIDGKVTSLRESTHGATAYNPVYQFRYEGKKYEASDFIYLKKNVPQINDTVKLLINPDDPVMIWNPVQSRKALFKNIMIGMLLIILGLTLIVIAMIIGYCI